MKNVKKEQALETIIIIALGFMVIYLWTGQTHKWLQTVAVLVLLVAFLSGYAAKLIHFGWMKIAHVMGAIMPKIILGSVFYFFLTPIALIYRMFRTKKLTKDSKSYYSVRDHNYVPKDMDHVW